MTWGKSPVAGLKSSPARAVQVYFVKKISRISMSSYKIVTPYGRTSYADPGGKSKSRISWEDIRLVCILQNSTLKLSGLGPAVSSCPLQAPSLGEIVPLSVFRGTAARLP